MDARTLLAQPHLSVVSGEPDFDLQQIARTITHSVTLAGRDELAVWLDGLFAEIDPAVPVTPKTLDLIGHTRSSASLVSIGDWLIDGEDPATIVAFRELAERDVLPRLGVRAVRLLGCGSAGTAHARATIGTLSDLLGLEVLGTTQLLFAGHYDAGGFRDCWRFLLVAASELRHGSSQRRVTPAENPSPRVLDLDALPAITLGEPAPSWPRRIATVEAMRRILQLVRRQEAAPALGPAIPPACELALPLAVPDAYHVAHVLPGGAFLRLFPDGIAVAGILVPVDDVDALREILATLPPAPALNP